MKTCLICKSAYDPQESGSFFNFKFCSDECEQKAEVETKPETTGVHMYMCVAPLQIHLYDNEKVGKTETVKEGSKWRVDASRSRGLNKFHLENLSGRIDEKITWLEVDEQALNKHFQKI